MNDNKKNLEQILADVTFDDAVDPGHEDLLEQKLLLNFNAVGSRHDSKWRIIMNMKIAKLAAAAVILIGVFVGYEMLKGTASEGWAQVRKRVAAVRAVMYKAEVTGTENGQLFVLHIEGIQSDDYGTRTDMFMQGQPLSQSFALSGEKTFLTLYPGQKKYSVVELTEAIRRGNGDPKAMVEAFLGGDYTELGTTEIDGVAVEGVESHDISPTAGFPGGGGFVGLAGESEMPGEVVGRLFVDAATGWPVEVTLDITDKQSGVKMTMVVRDFQWDVDVDADAFEAGIPEDYALMYKIDVSRLESGKQLIEGFGWFAEFSGGRYPAKMAVREIVGEVGGIFQKRTAEGGASVRVNDDQVANLKLGANYIAKLAKEGREPVYYGEHVTPADIDKVLLRWKLDKWRYRVIFGDLRIEDVSPKRLAELEAD
jgi:hypothetical protein